MLRKWSPDPFFLNGMRRVVNLLIVIVEVHLNINTYIVPQMLANDIKRNVPAIHWVFRSLLLVLLPNIAISSSTFYVYVWVKKKTLQFPDSRSPKSTDEEEGHFPFVETQV